MRLGILGPLLLSVGKELHLLTSTLVFAACVALLGGCALYGKGLLPRPASAVVLFVLLPLIASAAFNGLASLSGSG